jgi:hypothetical protein
MKNILWACALLIVPVASFAQGFDYTYAEGRIVASELNVGPFDANRDGIGAFGSLRVTKRINAFASYEDRAFDVHSDARTLSVGAGVHTALNPDWDLIGRARFASADFPGARRDDSGIGLTGGVRGRLAPKVEFDAGLDYVDLAGGNTSVYAAGRYALGARLDVGGGVKLDNGHAVLSVSVRGNFGGS